MKVRVFEAADQPRRVPPDLALGCPFCGCQPTVELWFGGAPTKVLIACRSEGCHANPSVTGETMSGGLRRWNRRKSMKDRRAAA